MRQIGGFLPVLRFIPPIKIDHDISVLLLSMLLSNHSPSSLLRDTCSMHLILGVQKTFLKNLVKEFHHYKNIKFENFGESRTLLGEFQGSLITD